MFGLLKGKSTDTPENRRRDLETFVAGLTAMDDGEVGMVMAVATAMRNKFAPELRDGIVRDPAGVNRRWPAMDDEMALKISALQKRGMTSDACAGMVWLHTLRAVGDPALERLGRNMWGELRRGFPHVWTAFATLTFELNLQVDVAKFDEIPVGLEPDI
jgi:hypothetical protein